MLVKMFWKINKESDRKNNEAQHKILFSDNSKLSPDKELNELFLEREDFVTSAYSDFWYNALLVFYFFCFTKFEFEIM